MIDRIEKLFNGGDCVCLTKSDLLDILGDALDREAVLKLIIEDGMNHYDEYEDASEFNALYSIYKGIKEMPSVPLEKQCEDCKWERR